MPAVARSCPRCPQMGVPMLQGDGKYYCSRCHYQYKSGEVLEVVEGGKLEQDSIVNLIQNMTPEQKAQMRASLGMKGDD